MESQDVDQIELIQGNLENNIDYLKKQIDIAKMLLKFNMGMSVDEVE